MIIENASNFVELEISAPTGPGQARRAGIGVGYGDFRGARAEIWIEPGEFEGFLQELRDLERTRQGQATLGAGDPRDFTLTLGTTDRSGHLQVNGCLRSFESPDGVAVMEFRFSLEPSKLSTVLREFELVDTAA
jgi:hypothetical protein